MLPKAGPRSAGSILLLAGAILASSPAAAQFVDCNRIALQISTLSRNSGSPQMQAAAAKQQAEIARTAAYAASIGCNRAHFLFFDDRPSQCDAINARIERMRANYAQLQRAAYGDSGAKQQLQNQYDRYCRAGRSGPNFLESLFGTPDRTYPPADEQPADQQAQDATPRGGSEAVCVRTCDGGFFPVSYSARQANLGELQELCSALCPNAEVRLYTRSLRDMKSAISMDGEPYTSLENAFKFEKTVVPQCACKKPDQSWSEALADAEKLLSAHKGDILVTPQKAEELSRPQQPGQTSKRGDKTAAKFDPKAMQKLLDEKKKAADAEIAAERAMADSAPTASAETSGIDFGKDARTSVMNQSAGKVREERDARGVRRRLRVLDE